MVTKPLKEFVDNKVKGYVHWDVEEWIFIREAAKKRNIPAHWVIKEMRNFITQRQMLKEEFEKHLDEKFRNLKLGKLLCPRCGFKAKNEKGIEAHIETPGACRAPLEVLYVR